MAERSLSEKYRALIDDVVEQTLKGNVRSKAQVRSQLDSSVEPGTGEIFERVVASRVADAEAQAETSLKAGRILRALKTIESEWQKGQADRQIASGIAIAQQTLAQADPSERPTLFLGCIPLLQLSVNTQQPRTDIFAKLKVC